MGINPFPGPQPCPIDALIKERLSSKWTSGYYPDVDRNGSTLMLVSPACLNRNSTQACCYWLYLCKAQTRHGTCELHPSPGRHTWHAGVVAQSFMQCQHASA